MLVVLVGFGALAVDVGALWWDKKQVQNGADAAALAVAQSCAEGECGDKLAMASEYAKDNKTDAEATVPAGGISHPTTTSVRVVVETTREHWLAPVLGFDSSLDSSLVAASATAAWGAPNKATTIPFAVSGCWFAFQTGSALGIPPEVGTPFTIPMVTKRNSSATPDGTLTCGTHAAHNESAGGFGWLDNTATAPDCGVTIDLANPWVGAYPGQNPDCGDIASVLTLGDTVLMPVFNEWRGSGQNAEYKVYAFAAFEVTGWCTQHSTSHGAWNECKKMPLEKNDGPNISGKFVKMVELGDVLEFGGPNVGLQSVRLVYNPADF